MNFFVPCTFDINEDDHLVPINDFRFSPYARRLSMYIDFKLHLFIVGTFNEVLRSFSIIRNINSIMNTEVGNRDLTYLHGMRVLSLFWVILFHVNCLVCDDWPLGKFRSFIIYLQLNAEFAK